MSQCLSSNVGLPNIDWDNLQSSLLLSHYKNMKNEMSWNSGIQGPNIPLFAYLIELLGNIFDGLGSTKM